MIPVSLYVSIELVKMGQIFFITQDVELYDEELDRRVQCRALNITEDLGQIQYVFSDKTGTLTENKMVFRRCTIVGTEYCHDENGAFRASFFFIYFICFYCSTIFIFSILVLFVTILLFFMTVLGKCFILFAVYC